MRDLQHFLGWLWESRHHHLRRCTQKCAPRLSLPILRRTQGGWGRIPTNAANTSGSVHLAEIESLDIVREGKFAHLVQASFNIQIYVVDIAFFSWGDVKLVEPRGALN